MVPSMRHEFRRFNHIEVRVTDEVKGEVLADVLSFRTPDDYRTTFGLQAFDDSLADHFPKMVWSHDWADPIGQWYDADKVAVDGRMKMRMAGRLDLDMINELLPAVPRAHQAWAQFRSGTIDQFSVGFARLADQPDPEFRGVTEITRAWLDEVSPVLVGSVPGTQLLATRSRSLKPERRNAFRTR